MKDGSWKEAAKKQPSYTIKTKKSRSFFKVFYRVLLLLVVLIPGILYVLGFSYLVTQYIQYVRKILYISEVI